MEYPETIKTVIIRGTPIIYTQLPALFISDVFVKFIRVVTKFIAIRDICRMIIRPFYKRCISRNLTVEKSDYDTCVLAIRECLRSYWKISTIDAREALLYILRINLLHKLKMNKNKIIYVINKNDRLIDHSKINYKQIKSLSVIECSGFHTVLDVPNSIYKKLINSFL